MSPQCPSVLEKQLRDWRSIKEGGVEDGHVACVLLVLIPGLPIHLGEVQPTHSARFHLSFFLACWLPGLSLVERILPSTFWLSYIITTPFPSQSSLISISRHEYLSNIL